MTVDVLRYVGAVTRGVEIRAHDGKPAKVVKATCAYDTDIDDLWDAITNVERLHRWFLPVSGDLRQGGRYSLKGNASGKITACQRPEMLQLTWEMGKDISWVHVRLSKLADGGSQLDLEHIAHAPEEFWNQYGPGAVGVGWDLALMGLRLHVADPAAEVDRAAAEVWPTTENGKDYIRRASDDWARASQTIGTPEAEAKASADRTYSFYTGSPA